LGWYDDIDLGLESVLLLKISGSIIPSANGLLLNWISGSIKLDSYQHTYNPIYIFFGQVASG